MMTIVLVWLLALALGAFAAREGFDLSWLWTGIWGLIVSVLAVAAMIYFQGSRATLTAFRDHLVDDLNTLWRRWSVWIMAAQGSIALMWLALPPAWLPTVPEWVRWAVVAILSLAAVGAAAVKQPSLNKDGG